MPDIIKINKEKDIIEVRSHGELSKKIMESTARKIKQIFKKDGIDKILVYTTELQGVPNISEIFDFMSHIPQTVKIAILINKEGPLASKIIFGEAVAFNRGSLIKTFSQVNDAIEWLNHSDFCYL